MKNAPTGKFIDNQERKQFELHVDDMIAFVDDIIHKKGTINLTYSEVPKEAEGQGYAKQRYAVVKAAFFWRALFKRFLYSSEEISVHPN